MTFHSSHIKDRVKLKSKKYYQAESNLFINKMHSSVRILQVVNIPCSLMLWKNISY